MQARGEWGCVTPNRGNVSQQICKLTRQINEVSLSSALFLGSWAWQALALCSRISESHLKRFREAKFQKISRWTAPMTHSAHISSTYPPVVAPSTRPWIKCIIFPLSVSANKVEYNMSKIKNILKRRFVVKK